MKEDENERAIRAIVECSVRVFADTYVGQHIRTYPNAQKKEFDLAGNLIWNTITLSKMPDSISIKRYEQACYKMLDNMKQCLYSYSCRIKMANQTYRGVDNIPDTTKFDNYL